MSTGHAFLAPSAAARWVVCPGSALMEHQRPEGGDKEAAAEGTACHWVMQMRFQGHMVPVGGRDPAGVSITQEMIEAAEMLYDDVIATLGPDWAAVVRVEQAVAIPSVHSQNWGTPDVRALTGAGITIAPARRTLRVWDLKYGHKHVEIFENWQLIDYALGCLSDMKALDVAAGRPPCLDENVDVVLRVVQPRSYHVEGPVREWRVTAADLRPFEFRLQISAEEACGPDPQCVPSPDACEHCSARHVCVALQKAAYHAIEIAHRAQSAPLTGAALGLEARTIARAMGLLNARMTGLEQQITSTIQAGQRVPFWAMEEAGSRQHWKAAPLEAINTAAMLGLDIAKPVEVITPKQAIAKGMDKGIVASMSEHTAGARKLKEDTGATARKTFSRNT